MVASLLGRDPATAQFVWSSPSLFSFRNHCSASLAQYAEHGVSVVSRAKVPLRVSAHEPKSQQCKSNKIRKGQPLARIDL